MRKIIVLFFCLLGCGIPVVQYLQSPIVNQISAPLDLSAKFTNSTSNDPLYFKGFKLYYCLFTTEDQLETSVTQIEATTYNAVSYLTSKGYGTLFKYPDASPLFTLDTSYKQKPVDFTVDFNYDAVNDNDDFESYITIEYGNTLLYKGTLCRYIEQDRIDEDATHLKHRSFKPDNFTVDDIDIPKEFTGDTYIYMALFVAACGWDDNMVQIHSDPKYLGQFVFNTDSFDS